jgi:hypothetical protein
MKLIVKIILGLIILVALAVGAFYVYVSNKKHTDYTKAKPEAQLTAAELYAAFVKNDLSAAKKYNGKVIHIEGIVDSIEVVDNRKIVLMFLNDGMFGQEGVRLELHAQEATDLDIGDSVILKGYCTGFSGSDVIVEHVTVVKINNN